MVDFLGQIIPMIIFKQCPQQPAVCSDQAILDVLAPLNLVGELLIGETFPRFTAQMIQSIVIEDFCFKTH
ncbi:hypothetical protein [Rhodopila sp.]|uniref:hypothetical protein n=1 Tax=Rhodopila sp. TaxID=2480087 RepID=UPI003D0DEC4A